MASVLVHTADENVTLSARAARLLLEKGDGDAALLYLALLRHHGTVPPRSLAGELRWERSRIEAAEETLRQLGLIASAAPEKAAPLEPADERPAYQRSDIMERLEDSGEFRGLVAEVEKKLGKKLTTPDVGVLLGLNDYLGLPADVIYLLVCHCDQRIRRRYGEGRRPTLRQIEKEGYAWARMGIDTQKAAVEYLKKYAEKQASVPRYMQVLGLGDRLPVASEEKYLTAWQEMGFPPESVALAYDKTVLKCHELKWPYCNGILKRWHEAGLHTPEEIQAGDRPAPRRQEQSARSAGDELRNRLQHEQQRPLVVKDLRVGRVALRQRRAHRQVDRVVAADARPQRRVERIENQPESQRQHRRKGNAQEPFFHARTSRSDCGGSSASPSSGASA